MTRAALEFFYEFGSPYCYLTVERICVLAEQADVRVHWRPFLLGPILAVQGLKTSPFNVHPAKGAHMWRDMERLCAHMGLPPLTRPNPFPAHSVLASRVAVHLNDASRPAFSRAVYEAEFAHGRDISCRETVRQILAGLGHFSETVIDGALSSENKARLRAQTDEAIRRGVFGAPTFITEDHELFWGNDRLELALEHAAALARGR
ncbi:2-hydroxychromene-2-carboxylate isomerase [Xanthobacter sp. TB0139]|uniref:2-hydroxychromene-2-carboxylate isomerase n=1 Tax=Xanthobacter sp. TB0139 TaxID=3459178 RepID=UPI00403A0ED6